MRLATQISFGFLIAISIDLLDSFINYRLTLRVKANQEFVNRSQAIIKQSRDLKDDMLMAENAFYKFLLTGDDTSLAEYNTHEKAVEHMACEVRRLVPFYGQQALLDTIVAFHKVWSIHAGKVIESRKTVFSFLAGAEWLKRLRGEGYPHVYADYNLQIDQYFRRFSEMEYIRRNQRKSALDAFIDRTDRYSLFFSILLILVTAGIGVYLVRHLSVRIKAMVQHAERIASGDFDTLKDNKQDELTSLTISLNSMSAQLSHNIGELEKKNMELDQFAYVVSHDLKAPVRGISHVVQWIREDLPEELTPAMQKYLNLITERIVRMEELIGGLLAYARAGREGTVWEWVDIAALLNEVVKDVVYKPFSLEQDGLPVIYTQRLPLQQVFTNLIGNAVKYSQEGVTVCVTYRQLNGWHEFSVSDNGPGIAPDYHEKVFGLFQTLRRKDDKESTGIGLAIVRKIIKERGGSIRISSVQGSGASFIFTLPINKE